MKEKIILRLKEKFPGVNLSKARLDAFADKLKVTEESEIDEALDNLNELIDFSAVAKQDDAVRNLQAKVKSLTPPTPAPESESTPETTPKPTPVNPNQPDLAKLIADAVALAIAPISQELGVIKTEKAVNSRQKALEDKLKDAPENYKAKIIKDFKRIKFETDEEFDEYLTETETDTKQFIQTIADNNLGGIPRPITPTGGGNKEASKEEAQALLKRIIPS